MIPYIERFAVRENAWNRDYIDRILNLFFHELRQSIVKTSLYVTAFKYALKDSSQNLGKLQNSKIACTMCQNHVVYWEDENFSY